MDNSRFNVLVVGARDFHIRSLGELGIRYTLFQIREELTSYQKDNANEIVISDYRNIESLLELAGAFHGLRRYDAVIGYRELSQYPCARVAESLSIPSNCNEFAVVHSRDKQKMRQLLKGTELDNVATCLVSSQDQVEQFLDIHDEAILKPSDGSGSIGVIKVTKDNVAEAYQYSTAGESSELLLEQFIGGTEYSVESLSTRGVHRVLAVTEKLTTGAPHFVEIGHHQPAAIALDLRRKIEASIRVLLDKIEHQSGPCHTEIKVVNETVYIIETHTRTGGDNIWELTQITTGTDLFKTTICDLLGIDLNVSSNVNKAAAIRYVMPKVSEIKSILNLEQANNIENVIRVVLAAKVGDEVETVNSSLNRCGYVLAQGRTLTEAVNAAEQAKETVVFE